MQTNSGLLNQFRETEWRLYQLGKRHRLKSHDFTVISSNCIGTFMYYDMGLEYLTPTINMNIPLDDLVKLAADLRQYNKDFGEAAAKWEERKQRINWEHICIVGAERDQCSYETLKNFDRLPYENKVVFTHIEYPEISSAYYIKGFEHQAELGTITDYKNQFLKRRYMDDFDYIALLNRTTGKR